MESFYGYIGSSSAAAQISTVRKLIKQDPDAALTHIQEAEHLTYDLRRELTDLIQELGPAALEDKGLASAVREYSDDWSRQNEIKVEVRIQSERSLPLELEQAVFRILQEALANAARHSQASNLEISLVYTKQDITCTIKDDGIGFNHDTEQPGFGLRSMQERANALGGAFAIESSPGNGTSLSFTLPLKFSPEIEKETSE
ncbi:MAG: sensor histidine kinase [Chloroflexi bacterium]|nr:sensor histidine kinase [Chloroflexota bacterium]